MGVLHVKVNGKTYRLDDQMTAEEAKEVMNLPPNYILVNSQNEVIKGKLEGQVRDGETLSYYPNIKYW